jgi:hypothetical protein
MAFKKQAENPRDSEVHHNSGNTMLIERCCALVEENMLACGLAAKVVRTKMARPQCHTIIHRWGKRHS